MRTISVVIALLLPLTASAQDTFTPQHVAKLRIVTEAVISPDGTQVAYVLAVPRDLTKEKDGGSWTELHVVNVKGGNSMPFITGQVNVGSIQWTPGGTQIAFLTKREKDEHKSLYVIGTKGGEGHSLLTHCTDILGYSFSGDGTQVAFLATEPTPAAKKKQLDKGFNQEVYEEDQPFVRVWISPAAPGLAEPRMLKLEGSASELHFNPKEDKLAVALAATPGIDDHIMFRKVHIVEIKLTGDQDVATVVKATNLNNPGKLGQLAWSPDGKKLAMITGADKHDPKEGRLWVHTSGRDGWKYEPPIYAYPPGDDGKIRYVPLQRYQMETIVWQDKDFICWQMSEGVKTTITFKNLEVGLGNSIWSEQMISSNLAVSANGKHFSFVAHTPSHPPEVFVFDNDRVGVKRLTNSNPWLKEMKFAKQEVIKYKARDGLELEGILIYPLGYDPEQKSKKRYPLVLTVHGGPEAHYSNGWLTNYNALGQVAAAKGMAVFYPNYRGSTGYGVEFSMKGQKDAGGKEFDDLIDGVDHLIKMGLVDEKKVGITGGSYGGYATAWGSTYYSHRFAAGVMFVGISDWISCSGTTDIPQEMFLVHHRKWLWDDWDYFAKASPLKYLDKAKTPLLIMHGKADPRVNPGQSLELYRHLKVRNQAPVRLVLYPGEGHGNRRAASRLDYNIRALQWMEHYLKGPGGAMPPPEIDYGLTPATKTSSLGWDTRTPQTTTTTPWLGRGCPCCIGW